MSVKKKGSKMTEQVNSNTESNEIPAAVQLETIKGMVEQVETGEATVTESFVGVVRAAGDAKVENTIASAIVAGGNASVEDSISMAVVAGGNIAANDSGGVVMVAGGNIDIRDGGGGLINCAQATIENGTVGVLLAGQVTLGDNVRVLMTQKQAIAFGAAFGLVVAVFGLIFRRRH
jgi:predicted RND superfamily exporter protein